MNSPNSLLELMLSISPSPETTTPSKYVIKRDGRKQSVDQFKIMARLHSLIKGRLSEEEVIGAPLDSVELLPIVNKVVTHITNGVTTSRLDEISADTAAFMAPKDRQYETLAGRILISNLHKSSSWSFCETMMALMDNINSEGTRMPLIDPVWKKLLMKHRKRLDAMIAHERDYRFSYFGVRTLERAYLKSGTTRGGAVIRERPQYMYMRVAIQMYQDDMDSVEQAYYDLSVGKYTHASTSLFNAMTPVPQMSSCFLAKIGDSIKSIYSTNADSADISQSGGGMGVNATRVRPNGAYINSTGGKATGIVPMSQVYEKTFLYVDQGGGKRKGSCAVYLEPWHGDFMDFLEMRLRHGSPDRRCPNLFYAVYSNDLFMERVDQMMAEVKKPIGEQRTILWSFFNSNLYPELYDTYGPTWREHYLRLEREGKWMAQLDIRKVWDRFIKTVQETGVPYMVHKDTVNLLSNQKNIGTISGSNLCAEIVQYHDENEIATCNLASIAVNYFVKVDKDGSCSYDHEALGQAVKQVVRNLNRVIDHCFYPVIKAKRSNLRHRPIGIGVQGLADTFAMFEVGFTSETAKQLNREIFETLCYYSHEASMELARDRTESLRPLVEAFDAGLISIAGKEGSDGEFKFDVLDGDNADCLEMLNQLHPIPQELNRASHHGAYSSFLGSPLSEGKFQFDLRREHGFYVPELSSRYDWNALRAQIVKHGVRNSQLLAIMPTASTAHINDNTEAIEPFKDMIYSRTVLAGKFLRVNKFMYRLLKKNKLWNKTILDQIANNRGSVQGIKEIPKKIQEICKSSFELKQSQLIRMNADRQAFVCQSISMNLWFVDPDPSKLTAAYRLGHKLRLKTGLYYVRRKQTVDPFQWTNTNMGAKLQTAAKSHETTSTKPSVEATGVPQPAPQPTSNTEDDDEDECLACGA